MNAPWEVWAGRNGYIGWEPKPELRVDGLHRYLRADLTCGECAKLPVLFGDDYAASDCPHAADDGPLEDDPACMAFASNAKIQK